MDHDGPFARAIRRSFILYSFVLPVALGLVGALSPNGRTLIMSGADLLIGILIIILPMLQRSRCPECFSALFHVGNMGYVALLFSRSLILDQPRAFLLAFLWSVVTIVISLRNGLDRYVHLYALIGQMIAFVATVHLILLWIHG